MTKKQTKGACTLIQISQTSYSEVPLQAHVAMYVAVRAVVAQAKMSQKQTAHLAALPAAGKVACNHFSHDHHGGAPEAAADPAEAVSCCYTLSLCKKVDSASLFVIFFPRKRNLNTVEPVATVIVVPGTTCTREISILLKFYRTTCPLVARCRTGH